MQTGVLECALEYRHFQSGQGESPNSLPRSRWLKFSKQPLDLIIAVSFDHICSEDTLLNLRRAEATRMVDPIPT